MNSDKTIEGIRAVMIIEVIGKPPEHLIETLEELCKQINEEKGVEIKEKNINPPILMKDQKEFYTSFVEIEVEVEEIMIIAMLMFKYMPAHIEIISPERISLSNTSWNEILNELTRRLHGYDEIARVIQVEKAILEKKLREVMQGKEINAEPQKESKKKERKKKKR